MSEETAYFVVPEGFDETILDNARLEATQWAVAASLLFQDHGLTEREACSLSAHALLQAAWAVATLGALSEGDDPIPERFLTVARDAISSVDMAATKANFLAFKDEVGDV